MSLRQGVQDLRRLAACLAEIAGRGAPPSQARAIGRYTAALLAEIRAHHENEDEVLWPVIAATAGQAVDLAPLTDDHRAIEAAAGRASQALASFRAQPGASAELHASVTGLRDMLDEHITDEEKQILPAMRRYLPAEAYRWCEKQIQRKAPRPRLRFTAPWLARYAQPDELTRLLATGGASADPAGRYPPGIRPARTPGIRRQPPRPCQPRTQSHIPITTRRRS